MNISLLSAAVARTCQHYFPPIHSVAVLRWGQGGTGPPNLAQPPLKFLDTVVLLLVELIGSIVISLSLPNDEGPGPPNIFS